MFTGIALGGSSSMRMVLCAIGERGERESGRIMKIMKRAIERADEPSRAGERLQKILAQAGIASRRAAEQIILEGRVQVNGETVTELGTKADLSRDHVRVDGKLLHGRYRGGALLPAE